MVFSAVNGPQISRIRCIQTPHGTINGLAVEATNKFAVTSQDKRLNIWSIANGKHMRAYKSDQITGELYKTDVDPSGMYVAACDFNKTISIFDFFSGELITQVTGQSPNPMDTNWGGSDFTQGLIDAGYYRDNSVAISVDN
jgi:WD40 repeat protein